MKHSNIISNEEPKEKVHQPGQNKRRFSLTGNMCNIIQGGFEDKFVKYEGDQINEEELEKIGIAYSCKKGLKPESPNQDDFLITFHDNYRIIGVFDGHGP